MRKEITYEEFMEHDEYMRNFKGRTFNMEALQRLKKIAALAEQLCKEEVDVLSVETEQPEDDHPHACIYITMKHVVIMESTDTLAEILKLSDDVVILGRNDMVRLTVCVHDIWEM